MNKTALNDMKEKENLRRKKDKTKKIVRERNKWRMKEIVERKI